MSLVQAMTVNQARKTLRISHSALTRILRYRVDNATNKMDLSGVRAICVDETSFKKGQSYVTVVCDAKARKVIDVEDGRDAQTIVNFSYKLEEKGGNCEKIKLFVSDMSSAYESAKELCFPNAMQVIDKFHVKQRIIEAMDQVRQEEQGQKLSRSKKSGKKLLMIPESRQTEQQHKKVVDTLKEHKEEILAYFHFRVTNAIAEGINSLIQAGKRKARGFRTFEGYKCMIYLVAGKLKLSCPPIFA